MTELEYDFTDADVPEPREEPDVAEIEAALAVSNGHLDYDDPEPADPTPRTEEGLAGEAAGSVHRELAPELPIVEPSIVVVPAAAPVIPRIHDFALTDLGNGELFAELHAVRFRHVRERRAWLVYQDGRWRRDTTGDADRAAKATCRTLFQRAADLEGDARASAVKHALASQSEHRLRAMLVLASSEPGIALPADALDRDPYLLACRNGTLNLRTGSLRAHDPADLISLGTDVLWEPDATCPRWQRFLDELFDGDHDLVAFVRRAIGYSLTGDTREHVVFLCHGAGCNGKTTLLEVIKRLCGDLAATAAFDSFARARGDRGVRNDLARLHRARFVAAAESGEGRRLDEATVKTLTGGDTIAVRFLYGEHFEFRPEFKLWLATNHRPRIDGEDDAIWRRLRLIPFAVSFTGREDKQLTATLDAELPGILAWAVAGCLEWQADGLGLPTAVERATAAYREDEDLLGAFLAERCHLAGEARIETAILREAYEAFCAALGERPLAAVALGRALARRGIAVERAERTRFYTGIGLTA